MKKTMLVFVHVVIFGIFWTMPCASQDYTMQKGAAIGAIGGAIAGQAIGRNASGTLIGAGAGALVGAVAGNALDQNNTRVRMAQAAPPPGAGMAPAPGQEAPPGEWMEVPGQWVGGKWVPPHRVWVAVNPQGSPPPVNPQGAVPPAGPQGVAAPPLYTFPAPPEVVLIPGTYAYFVPAVGFDIFFYHGYWYRPVAGRWYYARTYNGPWVYVSGPRVPPALVSLSPGWRKVPPGYRPIPHADLHRNWQRWERERHWDHHR